MAGYDVFARYYDALTANVDYKGRAAYLKKLLEHLHHEPGIVLDLACGTGSLTLELYKLGMDVYGVDGSIAMLSEAKDKAYDMEADVMFLYQKMQTLDLFGTVNTVFCSLDSINHLSGEAQVQAAFDRVAFFMDNDSWFIFDVNTLYKHEKVLGNNTYIYDLADIYCAWQNRYNPQDHSVAISLDFFEKEGKVYTRSSEHFFEHAYSVEKLTEMLKKSGFDRVEVFGDLSFDAPKPEEQRIIFAAHITNTLVQARLRAGRLRHDFPSGNGVASGRDGLATLHRPAVLRSTAVLSASNLDGRELLVQHPRMASSLDLAGLLRAIADIAHGLFDTRLRAGRLRHNRPSGIGVASRRNGARLGRVAPAAGVGLNAIFLTGRRSRYSPLTKIMAFRRDLTSLLVLTKRPTTLTSLHARFSAGGILCHVPFTIVVLVRKKRIRFHAIFCQRRDGKQHDQRHHGRKQQLPGLHRPYLQVLLCSTGIPARRSQFPAPPRGVII